MNGNVCGHNAEFACVFVANIALLRAYLLPYLRHGGRHKAAQQGRYYSYSFEQVVKHCRKAHFLALVLAQYPWRSFVDVLVRARNHLEYLSQRVVYLSLVDESVYLAAQCGSFRYQLVVKLTGFALFGQSAAEILRSHSHGARYEVSKAVRKVGIYSVYHYLVRERAVSAQRHLSQYMISDSVCAVSFAEYKGVYHVAQRLRHFLSVKGYPAVYGEVLRQRKIHSHQHRGPDYSVEAHDVLSHHVYVCGPELCEIVVRLVHVSQSGAIIKERVYPYINDVLRVECYRYAPCERCSRNAEVFKAGLDEVVDKLGSAGLGLKIICFGEQLLYPVRERRHLEEIRLFRSFLYLAVALRTAAVFVKLRLSPKALAGGTVFALVLALVYITSVIQLFEYLLYSLNVEIISSADVSVVADIHVAPEAFEYFYYIVNVLLRGNAFFLCLFLDLLTVLIGTCKEHNIVALHSFIPRDRVARNGGIAVTDMRITRWVIDRRSNVKL